MDVFMIGNGFDLHYFLPTSYSCFLYTVDYLSKKIARGDSIHSVACVLGDKNLYNHDKALKNCFDRYGNSYDAELNPDIVKRVFGEAANNLWFNYLNKSLKSGQNWIDFEQEIDRVVHIISEVLDSTLILSSRLYIKIGSYKAKELICSSFHFFLEKTKRMPCLNDKQSLLFPVRDEFINEDPPKSGILELDKNKIVSFLYDALRELTDMLAAYLILFVETPLKNLIKKNHKCQDYLLAKWNWDNTQIISFNYTHTIQILYHQNHLPQTSIHFLHGELREIEGSGLVLGIAANQQDDMVDSNVTFLPFKKFYQRVLYQADLSYISFLNECDNATRESKDSTFDLYIIGHSLDKTDHEVIRNCFIRADSICIFYHDLCAVSNYIRNLTVIFGKKQFENLRIEKKLRFISISNLNISRSNLDRVLMQKYVCKKNSQEATK